MKIENIIGPKMEPCDPPLVSDPRNIVICIDHLASI